MNFNKESTLADIMEFPAAEDILLKYKVPCLGCPMAKMEMQDLKLEQICLTYGINCADLLADLNAAALKYQDENKN